MRFILVLLSAVLISGCGITIQPTNKKNQLNTFTNSLGMSFKQIEQDGIFYCVYETRLGDFEEFVNVTNYEVGNMKSSSCKGVPGGIAYFEDDNGKSWVDPGFPQNGNHPVVGVNKNDAIQFADWLTKKERKLGLIKEDEYYRLPTNSEFDKAIGINPLPKNASLKARQQSAEKELHQMQKDKSQNLPYSWGHYFPPTSLDGNYHDVEGKNFGKNIWGPAYEAAINRGRNDGYGCTAPVGSYKPQPNGLYDVSGNVSEIVENDGEQDANESSYFTRGGSYFFNWASQLLPENSEQKPNNFRVDNIGFRLVLDSKKLGNSRQSATNPQ